MLRKLQLALRVRCLICCPENYVKPRLTVQISLLDLCKKHMCPRNCDQKVTSCLICTFFSFRTWEVFAALFVFNLAVSLSSLRK